jgi:CheY-like chemotaxis protein
MAFGRSTRILIVEDDHDSTEALLGLLTLWGFRPRTCRNGRAAMVAIETHPIDVILLDLGLPIMDGWKFAKQLAAAATQKRPFVVAISGYAEDPRGEDGIDMHLMKPVSPEQLLAILDRFDVVIGDGS